MKKTVDRPMMFLTCAGAIASLTACGQQETGHGKNPNIVFILMDDMGYSDLSCYGETRWKTSNIDSLASHGIQFTQCYSASPISSPSRAALLTGKYPNRMGIQAVFYPDSYTGLAPEETTIAEILKQEGYAASYIGKWHLGSRDKFLPLNQGFDSYFGIPYSNDMSAQVLLRDNDVEEFHVDIDNLTKRYTEEAVEYIENSGKRPFFLMIGHSMMHVPIYVSDEFRGKSGAGIYGDAALEVDWSVGEVMKAIRGKGIEDNTIVIFASDNGPWLQEGPLGGSAAPLREGKTTAFEGGVRVPCIVYWKGHVKTGLNHSLVTLMDWMPTLAHITGAELPDTRLDGYDITEVLAGTGERASQDYAYFHNNAELTNYRSGDWKLTLPFHAIKGNFWRAGTEAHDTLLFNLKEDPSERCNLYFKYPEKVRELARKADEFKKNFGDIPEPLVVTGNSSQKYLQEQRASAREEALENGWKPRNNEAEGFINIK